MKRELKIGDKVVVVCGLKSEKCKFYDMGDTGIIKELRPDGVLVDFRNQENKEVYGTGVYLMREEYLSNWIKQDPKPRFHNAQVGDEVYCRLHGEGIVVEPNHTPSYASVFVSFGPGFRSIYYHIDGRLTDKAAESTLFYRKGKEKYLTERPESEVDWSKVPMVTKVKVWNTDEEPQDFCTDYFMGYYPELPKPFWTFNDSDKVEACSYKYCKLSEPCKPEWRK